MCFLASKKETLPAKSFTCNICMKKERFGGLVFIGLGNQGSMRFVDGLGYIGICRLRAKWFEAYFRHPRPYLYEEPGSVIVV